MVRHRICYPFIGDKIGGSYVATKLLIERLDRSRFDPVVVVHEEGWFAEHLRASGVPYRVVEIPAYVGAGRKPVTHLLALARTAPRLLSFLRRENIALVHTNESPIAETWAVPTRLAGAPLVWHEHGISGPSRLHAIMQRLASRLICVSSFTMSHVSPRLHPRCQVIHNPFGASDALPDRGAARARLEDKLEIPQSVQTIGICGMLTRQKRLDVFIDAAAIIARESDARVHFLVIGDDRQGLRPELDARIRAHGITEIVHFTGWRDDATDLMAACALLLAPAVDEGFGRALVEAMLVGTPVIAADSGGHREIIETDVTGVLVPPDDAECLARAALDLLADPTRAAFLVGAARAMATKAYGADRHARAVESLYDDVLAARSTHRAAFATSR